MSSSDDDAPPRPIGLSYLGLMISRKFQSEGIALKNNVRRSKYLKL